MSLENQRISIILVAMGIILTPWFLSAHCQVPCGIYDDKVRIVLISEHLTTIEKAMKQIQALTKENPVDYNQVVRWVTNKEKHAEEIDRIISYYFLTQRIKVTPPEQAESFSRYQQQLTYLHQLLVYTMKTKQSTDISLIKKLRGLLKDFEKVYFSKS